MMTNHPLTDEICESIDPLPIKRLTTGYGSMRAAADWQLEQCINELNGVLSLFQLSGKINEAERLSLLNVFKNTMRPQEEDNQ